MMAKNCHSLYEGGFYKCSVAPFLPARLERLGQRVPDTSGDSVQVTGAGEVAASIRSYLADTTPLVACRWCLGSGGELMPNTQARPRPPQHRADDFVPQRFGRARFHAERVIARLRRAVGRSADDLRRRTENCDGSDLS